MRSTELLFSTRRKKKNLHYLCSSGIRTRVFFSLCISCFLLSDSSIFPPKLPLGCNCWKENLSDSNSSAGSVIGCEDVLPFPGGGACCLAFVPQLHRLVRGEPDSCSQWSPCHYIGNPRVHQIYSFDSSWFNTFSETVYSVSLFDLVSKPDKLVFLVALFGLILFSSRFFWV